MLKDDHKYKWFEDARFGMFIHWGIYSLLGRGEQVLFREHLDPVEYSKNAYLFKGEKFDADSWVRCAKDAGMKYMVFTSKHHDGFCLFETATTGYNSVRTSAGRDFVKEYTEACHRHGIRTGIYFSLPDWRFKEYFGGPKMFPDKFKTFVEYTHQQVTELCKNYGKIDLLWFDGLDWPHTGEEWESARLVRTMRKYQPDILINNRLPKPKEGGDWGYYTPEGFIGAARKDEMAESCMTSGRYWWGYLKGEKYWKTAGEVTADLVQAAAGGSNFLYNVGPKPDGSFPKPYISCLKEVGRWMKTNSRSIYGTSKGITDISTYGFMTVKDNSVFIHVLYWPDKEIRIQGIKSKVTSARYLHNDGSINFIQSDEHIILKDIPVGAPDPLCTVIELTMAEKPVSYPWAKDVLWKGDPTLMVDWAQKGVID